MIDSRYDFALSIVRKCGEFLLEHESLGAGVSVKHENDYVTVADRTVEDMLVKAIHSEYPEDSFFAEESGPPKHFGTFSLFFFSRLFYTIPV